MRPLILCRERLLRILNLIDRYGGQMPVRTFSRNHGVFDWEIQQAAVLGWLAIAERKPAVGRPSYWAEKLSKTQSAKLPPYRNEIPREIRFRHRLFAIYSVTIDEGVTIFDLRPLRKTEAYLKAYPSCRSRAAAAVAASRLMKRTDVKLMRCWLYCEINGEVNGPMPWSIPELLEQLEPLGKIRYSRH